VCTVLKVPFRAAAIPTIPVTAAHVILIVAIAITSPFRYETSASTFRLSFKSWILAETIPCASIFLAKDLFPRAKVIFSLASLDILSCATAVATIKIAIFVIIVRITVRIGFLVKFAFLSGVQFRLIFRVQTLAFGAVKVVVIFGGTAAVPTIPTTTAVIIFVIARLVSFPRGVHTWFAAYNALEIRIFATAFSTVKVCCFFSATVSAIPITAAVVVIVVAIAIATPLEHLAFPMAFRGHRRGIAALTLLAVTVLVLIRAAGVSTAVSTVPVATADIICVVAFSIALPLMHGAVFRALSISMDKRLVQT